MFARYLFGGIVLFSFLGAGCTQNGRGKHDAACSGARAVTSDAAAVEIAKKAANVETSGFRFDVEIDEGANAYFVTIIEDAKPRGFYALVTVDFCEGTTEIHCPF